MVIQKCENQKKRISSKNWLTPFVSRREKKSAFSYTLSVLAKMFFFGPKQCNAGNTIKIGGSAEIARKKTKWHLFWEKRCFFDMVEKVGFTNCVFEKLWFPENTIFIVFSAKHSFSKTKTVYWKEQKIYEKLWVVFEHGKVVFLGLFFEVSIFKRFVFGVSGIVSKVLKVLVCFPIFWAFLGWLIVVHLRNTNLWSMFDMRQDVTYPSFWPSCPFGNRLSRTDFFRGTLQVVQATKEWLWYCRKVRWTNMVQNGQGDHFGQKYLIPNRISALSSPKWTKMVHDYGPFGPYWSICN